jgi:hypothetical protein
VSVFSRTECPKSQEYAESRYQRIVEYIQNNYRENHSESEGEENAPKRRGGLVTIIPGNYDKDKECNNH